MPTLPAPPPPRSCVHRLSVPLPSHFCFHPESVPFVSVPFPFELISDVSLCSIRIFRFRFELISGSLTRPHPHAITMELPEKLFISVPGSTIFILFSHFLHFLFFLVFLIKKIGACNPDLTLEHLSTAVDGPYQYKNRGQNFLLAEQAASQGNSAWQWHAEG